MCGWSGGGTEERKPHLVYMSRRVLGVHSVCQLVQILAYLFQTPYYYPPPPFFLSSLLAGLSLLASRVCGGAGARADDEYHAAALSA